MSPFDRAIEFILHHEGGWVNDPNDSGGETKFGISKRSYPSLNIKELTRQEAIEIYRRDYWLKAKCEQLPSPLAMVVFDAAVNQGVSAAVRLLQRAVGVRDDGVIGTQTIAAIQRANLRELSVELVARRAYLYGLHPQFGRYGLGWMRRLTACAQLSQEPL